MELTYHLPFKILQFFYYFFSFHFRILDLSFNRMTEIKNLDKLVKLEKLYLCANKFTKIENLEKLTNLTMLELGDNRFRVSIFTAFC